MIRCPLVSWFSLFVLAPFLLAVSPLQIAQAEDWPQFRGPLGNGHSEATDLPVKWSDSKNVVWKVPVEGEGWSSPVVVEGRIYLTSAVPSEGGRSRARSLRTVCFDAKTGREIWNKEIFQQTHEKSHKIHNKNGYASGTPIVLGEHLYVHYGPQGTACLTLEGEAVWKNRDIYFDPRHGPGGSPIVVDDMLVFTCDGYEVAEVVALDRMTGELRWKSTRPPHDRMQKFSFCTPILIDVRGQQQIFSPGAYVASAYAPEDGRELWRINYNGFSLVPKPLFEHNQLYMVTGFLEPELLIVDPTGQGDVTETHIKHRTSRGAPNTPSLLMVGENLYMFSDKGIATCLNGKTGKQYWKKRIPGNYSSSPLFADGKIYIANESGLCIVLEEGRKFRKLSQNPMKERVFASFAPVDSSLIIRGEKHLFRVGK